MSGTKSTFEFIRSVGSLVVVVSEVAATKVLAPTELVGTPELVVVVVTALAEVSTFAFARPHGGEVRDQAAQGGFAAVRADRVG